MNFKKTVAGISAAAIAVTQVAAVIPMGAFAASEQPVKSGVGFALKLTSKNSDGNNYDGVYPSASDKKAVLDAEAISATDESTDLAFSYGGLITDGDIKAGDKYTFTADGLKIVANEKDKTTEDETTTVLEGPSILYNDRINVENAGDAGDVVTITYTKIDSDIKVVDANGAEISSDTSTDGTCTFTLTADSAGKFAILGSIEVSKVEVTKTKTTPLADIDFEQTEGSQTVNIPEGAIIGNKNTVAISIKQQYSDFDDGVPQCKINVSVNGESSTYLESPDINFDINSDTSEFIITGTNAKGSVELKSSTTTDLNISGVLSEPRTVSADEFANAKVGDKIIVYCSGDFSIKSGEKELTYTEEDGNAAVTIDSDNLNNIKTNGIALTGSGSTLIWVKFISVGETTEGKEVVLFNSDEPVVWSQTWMDGGYWAGEQAIDSSEISDSIGTVAAFEDNYENVTATWNSLKATKLVLDEGELWAGENTFDNDWGSSTGDWTHVGKTAVKKGGKIIVEYKDANNGQIMLKKSDYSEFSGDLGSALSTKGAKGSLEFTLDADAAEEISTNGFVIGGGSMTLTSVKYEAPAEKKIEINNKNFPDTNFQKVLKTFSSDGKTLSESDIEKITSLDSSITEQAALKNVKNFKGIENLTALEQLYITGNTAVTAIDLSKNENLIYFNAGNSKKLANMKLPDGIETIFVANTAITELNTDSFADLQYLDVSYTKITDIDVSKNTALTALYIHNTKITNLEISANTALWRLDVTNTEITDLDVAANTGLDSLYVSGTKITSLDISANTRLRALYAANCGLTKLDLPNVSNSDLKWLDVSGNQLTSLDLSHLDGTTNSETVKFDGNVRNIGEVVDGEYDLADLIKEGLDVSKMTIKTEGVTLDGTVLRGITGNVEYSYKTGSNIEGLETVKFTLAPEKVTSLNFYVSSDKSDPVVCETWNDVLNAMNDKNVDYTVMLMDNVNVDKLTFPTAAKAKSVTISSNDRNALTITTKSASVTLPTDVKLANVNINVVDNNGKQAKSFTLSASKDLKIDTLSVNADKAVIKGAAKSTLTIGGLMPGTTKVAGAEITGFGTVAVPDGYVVTFDKTVKATNLNIGSGATAEFGSNSATFTNIEISDKGYIVYNTTNYTPVSVTGNITGDVIISAENADGSDIKFDSGNVILVSKNADLANIRLAASSSSYSHTVGRVGSNIAVMDAVFEMNGKKYAQWSDALSVIAANAKADKAAAAKKDYLVMLDGDLDVNGAFKMPAAGTFNQINIIADPSDDYAIKFTGNITLTGDTVFRDIKLNSVKKTNAGETSVDFSIAAGKNMLYLGNVKPGTDKNIIKSITSSGTVSLTDVKVSTINAAVIVINNTQLSSADSYGALVNGEWEGSAIKNSSVTVTGNLTAKDELRFFGSLSVNGILNAGKITSYNSDATLVLYKQAKGKNALVIGKNGIANDSEQIKFVLADAETNKTAQITEDLVLGTIAGPYADQFVPSDDSLAETDSYRIIKDGNKLIAVPKEKDQKEYLVKVTVNGKAAYYKSLDAAVKDISATGSNTDEVVITVTQDMFTDTLANLPLSTAGTYGTLTYTAASDVTINVTNDLTLTGNLIIDNNVVINKVDKNGKVLPISLNIGKYNLTVNGDSFSPEVISDTEDWKQVNNRIANISGTGTINAYNISFDISGKANAAKVVLDKAGIMLSGKTAGFTGSIESSGPDSLFAYDKSLSKNVKFNTINGELTLVVTDGGKLADVENTTLASITGDFTGDDVTVNGEKELKVVRSGNTLKAVKAENVVKVGAYYSLDIDEDDDDSEPFATRNYDSVASAINDISRIKDRTMSYKIPVNDGDVITLPKANTYDAVIFESEDDVTVKTAKDLALTGNLAIYNNVTVKKTDGKAINVNLGNYTLYVYGKVDPDADGVSQFNNINGKGSIKLAAEKAKVSGKVNVGAIFIGDELELGSKSTFSAEKIMTDRTATLKYPASIAKNVKLGEVEDTLNLSIDGVKEGDQVAAPLNSFVSGSVIINNDEHLYALRSGSKLIAVHEVNAVFLATEEEERMYASYADAIADINKAGTQTTKYMILLPANANITKLTLPAKNKYQSITLCAPDSLTIKLTSDVALTGNLIVGQNVILQKNEGGDKDILKFTSPTDSKTKKALYTVEAKYGGVIINGTLNGEKIDSPVKPVTKEIELGGEVGEFDLSNNNVLKVKKNEDVKVNGTITVTLKGTITTPIAIRDSENNALANSKPAEGETYVTFIIGEEMHDVITETGFRITGDAGIVTGVIYTAPEPAQKTEVNGTLPFGGKEVDLSTSVLKIAKTNVAENNSIIVTLKANVTSEIVIKDVKGDIIASLTPAEGETTVSVTLTNAMADAITANGFTIEGEAGIVTGVTYTAPEPAQKTTVEGTLPYSGSVDLSTSILKIAKTNAAEDNTIIVTFKDNVKSNIVIKDSKGNPFVIASPGSTTTETISINSYMANEITANGFIIEGNFGIVTNVTITSGEIPGLDD